MIIKYIPSISGISYMRQSQEIAFLNMQVLETQGLLSQLALHAGIHVEATPYPVRLANYHNALIKYDSNQHNNIYHCSVAINSISVAKALLGWRDTLSLAGWNCNVRNTSDRLNALSNIENYYQEKESELPVILEKIKDLLENMEKGNVPIPTVYKELVIEVLCKKEMLPDFLMPVFNSLEKIIAEVKYGIIDISAKPQEMEILEFSQQYKAEAWMSQLEGDAYDVWINSDNKRLDNWLHMSGKPVAGSDMLQSNPQITQMFPLAIQLFQRPLNVNTFLQYLYLPECPLPWKLTNRLASTIVREGGFTNKKVVDCINSYLSCEFKNTDDNTDSELSSDERISLYQKYLPFDLRDKHIAEEITNESEGIYVQKLTAFLNSIKNYASERALKISTVLPYDLRIDQLREVATLIDALLVMLKTVNSPNISFATLQQWAQSIYNERDFCQYNSQIGSRFVINHPANLVTPANKVIWCDFYGDICSTLSTDFLSPREIKNLQESGVLLWDPEKEKAFHNFTLEMPLHHTKEKLTFIACKQKGTTVIPTHPLRLQLPENTRTIAADEFLNSLPTVDIHKVDNHREEDAKIVTFNADEHKVNWREQESYSSLTVLLQNPLDYFMNYILGFSDKDATEIKMSVTYGNVAHETIETLFTADRGNVKLKEYVKNNYNTAFAKSLASKGALLLLPENHFDYDTIRHQLLRCVINLAEVIEANNLQVVRCEQEVVEQLEFEEGITIKGFIDMLLKDGNGNDVVFDLKWTSKKDKHSNLIKNNRDAQLAIYKEMLQHPDATRTAFFVMPKGCLISSDNFANCHFEKITRITNDDIMNMIRNGYTERRKEISRGEIETSNLLSIKDIEYSNTEGVFPLETDGKVRDPKKAANEYSDYKCFTL